MALHYFAIISLLILLTKETSGQTCDLSYDGTCYNFVQKYNNWYDAEEYCVEWGGHLVSIHSEEESKQISTLTNGYTIWIGMTDSEEENVWKWIDGSDNSYDEFYRNPPYDCYGNQDCAYTYSYGYYYYYYYYYGHWNDYYCSYPYLYSVCSQPVPMPSEPRGLVVTTATSTSLAIVWEAPISHYNSLTQYTVLVLGQELDTEERELTIVTSSLENQTYTLYGLEEANLYTISVSAHTSGGEGRPITVMNIMTMEDAPSGSPIIEGAYSSTPTEIDITWTAPAVSDRNGIITSYSISYTGMMLDTSVRVIDRDGALPRMLTLTSLEEFTQYKIEVAANTAVGAGPAATSFVMTAADAPTATVTDHVITTLTSTQLFVSWNPPSLADRNGVLSYKVSHMSDSATGYTTAGVTTMLSFTLTGLEEAVTYDVKITPVSVGLDGPDSIMSATTLMDVPNVSARNFMLTSSTTTTLTVSWDAPAADDQNGDIINYVIVYSGADLDQQERMTSLSTSATGFTTSYTASSLEADTSYSFSIIAYTSIGSGPALTVTGFKTDQDVPSDSPNDISPMAVSSTSLSVSWTELALIARNGPISHYTMYYTGLRLQPETKTITVVASGRDQLIEGLEEDSEYSVSISASTLVGEGPKSEAVTVSTLSDLPSAPVTNLNASAQSSGSVLVEFDELVYEHRNGKLTGYQVMYWRNAEDSRIHNMKVASSAETGRVSVMIRMLMPYTSYRIQVSAYNSQGSGEMTAIPSVYTHEDFPIIEISSTRGASSDPNTATLTWTKPNCVNETQISNTLYNLTYRYTDHMMMEHTNSMVTPDNFLSVEGLLPYTEYNFDVTSFTGAGTGSVGPKTVIRTKPKVPSTSVSSMELETINCSTILVTCYPPAPEHQNGLLHSYSIFYTGNLFDTVMREVVFELSPLTQTYPDSTVREFYISELMEYEMYSVMVRVSTFAGYSEYSAASTVRTSEAAPTEAPQDIMSMYSTSTCVQIEWNPPSVTSQRGAITSYTIMFQGVERDTTAQTVMKTVSPVFPDMRHQSHLLCDLMEDTTYRVSVQCENIVGVSAYSSAVDIKSKEAAPTGPPTNLMVTSHTPYTTTLTWTAPAYDHQNGIILSYNIELLEAGMSQPVLLMAPSLSYNLSPLKAYTSYTISVSAVTAVGAGPSSPIMLTTPQDIPSHGVSSLMLTERTSTSFSLSWMAPSPSQRRGVLVHYKLRYYGFTIDTSVHSTTVMLGDVDAVKMHTIEGLEEYANYTVEITVVGELGDGPVTRLTHICTLPIAPSSPVMDLKLVSVTSRYSIISWMPPPISEHNGPLGDYKITVTSSTGSEMEYTSMRTSYRIEELMEHTMYSVSVVSTNMEGEGPEAVLSFTTLKNVPSGAPLNFSVSDIGSTSLLVHWSPPAVEDRNGDLKEYMLVYMGEMMDTSMRTVRITVAAGMEEMEQSYLLEGLEEYTTYTLVLSVLNDKGESPVVRLQNVQTLPTVPSSPVSGLKIETISSKDALISWMSPDMSSLNGAEVRFRVHLSSGTLGRSRRSNTGTEMYTTGQHVMLTDLSPDTSYSLSVQPTNTEGTGPASMLDINTMEDVPSAPVQNITLSDITATGLSVSWSAPPLAHQNGAILLYTVHLSDVNSEYTQTVTSQDMMTQITGLHADTTYTVTVTTETSMGSGLSSSPIEFSTMESAPSATVEGFSIIQLNSTAVLLTWTPPVADLQNGDITHYSLSYTSHSLKESFSLTTKSFFFYIYTLNATDGYTFKLTAYNSMGAGPVVIETITYEPTSAPSFQFSEKEMSYAISGVLLTVILLMLIIFIIICIVILMCRRSAKKPNSTLQNLEMDNTNNRANTIYTGMRPIQEKPPTYANVNKQQKDDKDSLFKTADFPEDSPVKKTDAIYAIPHEQTGFASNTCGPDTYVNPNVVDTSETKNSTEA